MIMTRRADTMQGADCRTVPEEPLCGDGNRGFSFAVQAKENIVKRLVE